MRRAAVWIPLALLTVVACGSSDDDVATQQIVGAPSRGTAIVPSDVPLAAPALLLSSTQGVIVVGLRDSILRGSATGDSALASVSVVAGAGEIATVGTPLAIAARGTEGWFVLSDRGLFHSASTVLTPSPAAAPFVAAGARSLSVTGTGATETLWITGRDGALFWRGGELTSISLSGVDGKIERVVGIDDHRALLAAGDALWESDVSGRTVTRLATGFGTVADALRADDGTSYFATSSGLWSVGKDRIVRRRTFAAEGASALPVRAVSASFDTVAALVENDVVTWDGATAPHVVGSATTATQVVLDVNGDTWTLSPRGLQRFATGKPVSFERDVKPFFAQHCQSCHATGASGAPVRAFDQLEVAKGSIAEIVKRLRADGRPVMPPTSQKALQPADYRAVLRWQSSGMPL